MRGIITAIEGKRAIILTNEGTFEEIRNRSYEIGQEVSTETPSYKKQLWIAACFAMVCALSFGGAKAYYTPSEYIYMDINPSLRLDINLFHRVIAVNPLNEDAKNILSFHKEPEKCVEAILDECIRKGYLDEQNNDVEINVFGHNKNAARSITDGCAKYEESGYRVYVQSADKQEVKNANASGISVSAYRSRQQNGNVQMPTEKKETENPGDTVPEKKDHPTAQPPENKKAPASSSTRAAQKPEKSGEAKAQNDNKSNAAPSDHAAQKAEKSEETKAQNDNKSNASPSDRAAQKAEKSGEAKAQNDNKSNASPSDHAAQKAEKSEESHGQDNKRSETAAKHSNSGSHTEKNDRRQNENSAENQAGKEKQKVQ